MFLKIKKSPVQITTIFILYYSNINNNIQYSSHFTENKKVKEYLY